MEKKTIVKPARGCEKAFIFMEDEQLKKVLLEGTNSPFAKEDLYNKERNGDVQGFKESLQKISRDLMERGYPFSENDLECQWCRCKYQDVYNSDGSIAHKAVDRNTGSYMKLRGIVYRTDHPKIDQVKKGIAAHYDEKGDLSYDLYRDYDEHFSYLCRNFYVAALRANMRTVDDNLNEQYWKKKYRVEKKEYKYEVICKKSPEYTMNGYPLYDVFHPLKQFINNMKLKYMKMKVSRSLYTHADNLNIFQLPHSPLHVVPASENLIFQAIQAQLIIEQYFIDTDLMKEVWHDRRGVICDGITPDDSGDWHAAILMTYCRKVATLAMKDYKSLDTVSLLKANKKRSPYSLPYDEIADGETKNEPYRTFWMILLQNVIVHDLTLLEDPTEAFQLIHKSIVKYGFINVPMKVWMNHWEITSTHFIIHRIAKVHSALMEQIFPSDPFIYEEDRARVKVAIAKTWDHPFLITLIIAADAVKLPLCMLDRVDANLTRKLVNMRSQLRLNYYKMEVKHIRTTWSYLIKFFRSTASKKKEKNPKEKVEPLTYKSLCNLVRTSNEWKVKETNCYKPLADPLYWDKKHKKKNDEEEKDEQERIVSMKIPIFKKPLPASEKPSSSATRPSSSTTQRPSSSTTQRPSSSTTQKPSSSTAQRPSSSTTQKPSSSTTQRPSTSIIIQKPSTSTIIQKPSTFTIIQKPSTSTVIQKPSTSTIIQKPSTSTIIQKPSTSTIIQKPSSSKATSSNVEIEVPDLSDGEHANQVEIEVPDLSDGEHANQVVVEVIAPVNGKHANEVEIEVPDLSDGEHANQVEIEVPDLSDGVNANQADVKTTAPVNGKHENEDVARMMSTETTRNVEGAGIAGAPDENTVNNEHSDKKRVLNQTIPILPPGSLPATDPNFDPYKEPGEKIDWEENDCSLRFSLGDAGSAPSSPS